MSTLLSRIFGRKKQDPVSDDRIDVSALKPMMSPAEFANLKASSAPAPAVSLDPADLNGSWQMQQVLKSYPSAQRALFRKYHIGGCSSCGYTPQDTLDKVSRDHGLDTAQVVDFIKESASLENDLEISPAEVAQLLKQGTVKLLDVRSPQEYEIAHIEGSVLVDPSIAQEIVNTWPAETAIVTMCHHGMRSLDAAAYLRGHGFLKTQSMRGGIDAWSTTVDPSVPRY